MKPTPAIRPFSPSRGLTLVEITIALLILGLLVAAAIPSTTGVTKARLKSSAGQLAGAIKYVYNYSVMQSQHCRMVFDMEEHFYYTECTPDPIYIVQEKEEQKSERQIADERADEEKPVEDETNQTFAMSEEDKESWRLQNYKPTFQDAQTMFMKATKLPDDVYFEGVWVMHQREIFRRGDSKLYFFPKGFVELAYIYIADKGGKIYTLTVSPLTGRVRVDNKYIEPPRS